MTNDSDKEGRVMTAKVLLYLALTSPGNEELLGQLRVLATEVIEAVDVEDVLLPQDVAEGVDELWIARVYEALAGPAQPPKAEEVRLEEALFKASAEDVASVGAAFKQTLLPGLPQDLINFPRWFKSAPQISVEQVAALSRLPDVETAFPISAQLIVYGVTPCTIFYASEAVAGVVDRLIRIEALHERDGIVLASNRPLIVKVNGEQVEVPFGEEIARVAECDMATAEAIWKWLLSVAQYKPQVFGGFEADPVQDGVRLRRVSSARATADLYRRWSLVYDYA